MDIPNSSVAPGVSRSASWLRAARRRQRRRHLRLVVLIAGSLATVTGAFVFFIEYCFCNVGCGDGAREQAYEFAKSIDIFVLQNGRRPRTLDELVIGRRPIMEEIPRDPWGTPYALISPGLRNPGKFDVVSAGKDGLFFTADDKGNW